MNLLRLTLLLLLAIVAAGCGKTRSDTSSPEPLTMEAWTAMAPDKKFEIETFERLKLGNPKLQDDREWNRFARTVMLPAMKKELPRGKQSK